MATRDKVWIDELGIYITIPTAELGVPTLDPTTGDLIDPATGASLSPTPVSIMQPASVSPLVQGTTTSTFTAAAASTETSGIAGTFADLTPVAAGSMSRRVHGFFRDDWDVRTVTVTVNAFSNLACAGLFIAVNPGSDAAADTILAAGASANCIYCAPGTTTTITADDTITDFYIAWKYAAGSGYTGARATIAGGRNNLSVPVYNTATPAVTLTSPHISLMMAEGSGLTLNDTGNTYYLGGTALTIAGAEATMWSGAHATGWLKPDGAAGTPNTIIINTTTNTTLEQVLRAHFKLSTLSGIGHLVCLFYIYGKNQASGGNEYYWGYSAQTTANGGIGLRAASAGTVELSYCPVAGTIIYTPLMSITDWTNSGSGRTHALILDFDCIRNVCAIYDNGAAIATAAMGGSLPTLGGSTGFNIFNQDNDGNSTPNFTTNKFGSNTEFQGMRFIRFEHDLIYPTMMAAAKQFQLSPTKIPEAWRGM